MIRCFISGITKSSASIPKMYLQIPIYKFGLLQYPVGSFAIDCSFAIVHLAGISITNLPIKQQLSLTIISEKRTDKYLIQQKNKEFDNNK